MVICAGPGGTPLGTVYPVVPLPLPSVVPTGCWCETSGGPLEKATMNPKLMFGELVWTYSVTDMFGDHLLGAALTEIEPPPPPPPPQLDVQGGGVGVSVGVGASVGVGSGVPEGGSEALGIGCGVPSVTVEMGMEVTPWAALEPV
jgi:hypothetical protein